MFHKIKKLFFYTFILFFTFFNYSLAKEKMYYCIEIEKTGFAPKQNFKRYGYNTERFKAKIDFENNFYSSKDRSDSITNCRRMVGTFSHIMQCHTIYGTMFAINTKNLRFAVTDLIGINGSDDLVLSHGTCEEF